MYGEIEREMEEDMMGGFSYQTEQQAAYSLSQLTQEYPRDGHKVREKVAEGRFVVVVSYPVYCVHTDAMLPQPAVELHSDYATRAEAMAVAQKLRGEDHDDEEPSETSIYVEPAEPRATSAVVSVDASEQEDIPF
jgi:hypothetical protein